MGNPQGGDGTGTGTGTGRQTALFLDDSEERHRRFLEAVGDRLEVRQARSAAEAVSLLEGWVPDHAFLDHDLSEEDVMAPVGCRSAQPTGMAVVDHILGMERPPPQVTVHSCNAPAAIEMERRLRSHREGIRVSRVPFFLLMDLLRSLRE